MSGRPRPRLANQLDRLHPPAGFAAYLDDEFVERLAGVIGRTVLNVRYWDGGPTHHELPWEQRGNGFDVCDGVELDLDDAAQLSIQGHGGGLAAFSKSVLELDPFYATKGVVWDVSTRSRWAPLIGRTIVDVCIYAAGTPCDVELVFDDASRVYLAAAAPEPGAPATRPGAAIVVAFDERSARELGVGAHGPGRAVQHPGRSPTLARDHRAMSGLEPDLGGGRATPGPG